MDYYTSDRLIPYAHGLKLSEDVLHYIAIRINWGEQLSLMKVAKEIQKRFNEPYLKQNTVKGRPVVYSDLCLLCMNLSANGHGRMLKVNLDDCIYIGDIEV